MDNRKCEKCSTIKEINNFRGIVRKDIQYYSHSCNQCISNFNKLNEIRHKEKRNDVIRILDFPDNKICTKCKIVKSTTSLEKSFEGSQVMTDLDSKNDEEYVDKPQQVS